MDKTFTCNDCAFINGLSVGNAIVCVYCDKLHLALYDNKPCGLFKEKIPGRDKEGE